MSPISNAEINETEPSKYRVIQHGRSSDPTEKIRELSFILDHWDVFTENLEDEILDEQMSTAMIGSAYTQSSSALTLRQLFGIWRNGKGIHASFYDENRETITEPLYMVGMGGSVLSGAFVFWGIVPSQGLIVISNISPEPGKCNVRSNIIRYLKAFRGE
ncbi:hypothetical protein [Methanogenium sp. MK-MG]|uniref:hypothetical protein n=1 Tax=Methanogenium sp. MK-MG TaxID=2599926 RepID=UPI0013EE385F|nr:hypothetical protein [Methanogenium sp. MK-MG]KAF1078230.1 hypothetical protein MKMG_00887 [Methanogenium sp. MK-MG]